MLMEFSKKLLKKLMIEKKVEEVGEIKTEEGGVIARETPPMHRPAPKKCPGGPIGRMFLNLEEKCGGFPKNTCLPGRFIPSCVRYSIQMP
jgi:hypothetical protein